MAATAIVSPHGLGSSSSARSTGGETQSDRTLSFRGLTGRIRECLGSTAGIDASPQHLAELIRSMEEYHSSEEEWQRYALADPSRAYTRNLVDDVNGHANLLVLVWNPRKASPAHCHSNAHCLMKVLAGELEETLYEWPQGAHPMQIDDEHGKVASDPDTRAPRHAKDSADGIPQTPNISEEMVVKRRTRLGRDQVTYISDALGVHRIGNPSDTEVAVSLHLYTPPWASKYGCQIFDERTGKAHRVNQCGFYSIDGVKSD